MVTSLPEQLIARAESLLRNSEVNEANVRRAVSSAYYALFHLLIRDAIANWRHADHHSRLVRTFDHNVMKNASITLLKELGRTSAQETGDDVQSVRSNLLLVAQSFVDLQQARHKADYNIAGPFAPIDAAVEVAQARLAFTKWAEISQEPAAQGYLYSLLFKDRS